jgi:hypothetical protein
MKPHQPETPQEWREAVNLAELYSLVDAAVKYGLVTYTGEIDINRCDEILEQGRQRGVYPVRVEVDALMRELVRGSSADVAGKQGRPKQDTKGSSLKRHL